jgi:hypothetical protein
MYLSGYYFFLPSIKKLKKIVYLFQQEEQEQLPINQFRGNQSDHE